MTAITVVGAGPLGTATATELLAAGHDVTVVTRSGTPMPGCSAVAADLTEPSSAAALPPADAIVASCNFPYSAASWEHAWPRAIDTLIRAAEQRDATLVITGNLYAAGPRSAPMREHDEPAPTTRLGRVRARVWAAALAAHEAGRIGAVEVRGSDYLGPGASNGASASERIIVPASRGATAWPVGDPDAPHAWTSTADFGRLLARAATDASMAGRAWHVPNAPAVSARELARIAVEVSGRSGEPTVRGMPTWFLRASGAFSPMLRAVADMSYQFTAPFLVDDTDARTLLGETHTPLAESVAAQLAPAVASPSTAAA